MYVGSVRLLKRKNMVEGMEVDESIAPSRQCAPCIEAKQHRTPFLRSTNESAQEIGELTVSDVWGPTRIQSIQGNSYYISFTDAKSCRSQIYFMKNKSQALQKFKYYKSFMETQKNKKLKILRTDNGGEYVSEDFKNYCKESGIRLQYTAPDSPAQNGISERLNRTLAEHGQAMLIAHKLPTFLWEDAIAYATYLKNRSPHHALPNITPHESFWGEKPNVKNLQEFGTKVWVLDRNPNLSKLNPRSNQFNFTGLGEDSKSFHYYDARTWKILTSRDIIFSVEMSNGDPDDEIEIQPVPLEGEKPQQSEQAQTQSQSSGSQGASKPPMELRRTSHPVTKIQNYATLDNPNVRLDQRSNRSQNPPTEENVNMATALIGIEENQSNPQSFEDAMSRTDLENWLKAMKDEIDQLEKLGTYQLEDLPMGRQAVGNKWVYNTKINPDGSIRHKARLVAQGFSQRPSLDYFDTYSPVMRMESLRVLLAIAANLDWEAEHMDVVGAYLNGELEEMIYMHQLIGFTDGTAKV